MTPIEQARARGAERGASAARVRRALGDNAMRLVTVRSCDSCPFSYASFTSGPSGIGELDGLIWCEHPDIDPPSSVTEVESMQPPPKSCPLRGQSAAVQLLPGIGEPP